MAAVAESRVRIIRTGVLFTPTDVAIALVPVLIKHSVTAAWYLHSFPHFLNHDVPVSW